MLRRCRNVWFWQVAFPLTPSNDFKVEQVYIVIFGGHSGNASAYLVYESSGSGRCTTVLLVVGRLPLGADRTANKKTNNVCVAIFFAHINSTQKHTRT